VLFYVARGQDAGSFPSRFLDELTFWLFVPLSRACVMVALLKRAGSYLNDVKKVFTVGQVRDLSSYLLCRQIFPRSASHSVEAIVLSYERERERERKATRNVVTRLVIAINLRDDEEARRGRCSGSPIRRSIETASPSIRKRYWNLSEDRRPSKSGDRTADCRRG